MCPDHEDNKIINKVYAGELPSSPLAGPSRAMEDTMETEPEPEVISPRPCLDLSGIKRRLHEALGCTILAIPCGSPECLVHQASRPSSSKPLYGGPLSHLNIIRVVQPPRLPHHDQALYEVYNDIQEEEEDEVTRWQRAVDDRDAVQAVNEMETIWPEQMIKGYRNDPV